MKVTVIFFGALSSITNRKKIEVEDVHQSDQLLRYLLNEYPTLANYKFKVALNQQTIHDIHPLSDGDEIALLPPFAGG